MLYHKNFTRRHVMQGLGLGGIAGFAPSLRPNAARASWPLRLVCFYTYQGLLRPSFRKEQGGERDFKLGPISRPLDKLRDKAVILDGIDFHDPAGAHGAAKKARADRGGQNQWRLD